MSNFFFKGGVINTAQYSVVQYTIHTTSNVFDPQTNSMKELPVLGLIVDTDKNPNFDGIQVFMSGVQGQGQIMYMDGDDMYRFLEVLRQENES